MAVTQKSICAVVVTYNRLALLQECVAALRIQSRRVNEIIVVDNGSTDGTSSWLKEQNDLTVVRQVNGGSSGGQYTGIRTAVERGHDWVWVMDDDTIPLLDTLERFAAVRAFHSPSTSFLVSLALWTDGALHAMNITPPRDDFENWYRTVVDDRAMPVRNASFVSLLVNSRAVAAVGLPLKEFFIWYDDVEYTKRLSRAGDGYLVFDSRVIHKTSKNAGVPNDFEKLPSQVVDRYCVGMRNRVYLMRMENMPRHLKVRALLHLFRVTTMRCLRGNAPFKLLWWATKGIWFNPQIEFARPKTSDSTASAAMTC